MNIFYDTEFTGLTKDTSLISIGLSDEYGNEFYGILDDYDKSKINEWLQKNVIDNLGDESDFDNNVTFRKGNKEFIKSELLKWLNKYDKIIFVSDVSHYDMVLLIDLLYEHGLNIPMDKVCIACHDINQDIAGYLNINEISAADVSREDFIEKYSGIQIQGKKHNSLYDALVIKEIYHIINGE